MIIFGSRTKSLLAAVLFFTCTRCNSLAAQRLFRIRTWFTLFFAPIFPLGHGRYTMQCAFCGAATPLTREGAEQFIADAERVQAEHLQQETLPPAPSAPGDLGGNS